MNCFYIKNSFSKSFIHFKWSLDCACIRQKCRVSGTRTPKTQLTVREDGGFILKFARVSLANARGEEVLGY
jgi:hypothetical protein